MQIATAILCRDQGRTLEAALLSAKAQQPAELLIIDWQSAEPYTLQLLARLRADGVRVLRTEVLSKAAACNLAVRSTLAEALVILDADDRLHDSACAKLALRLTPGVGIAGCFVRAAGRGLLVPGAFDPVSALSDGFFPGMSLFHRAAWEATGGFDESVGERFWEDFCLLAMERGIRGECIPEVLCERAHREAGSIHAAQASFAALIRKHVSYLRPHTEELLARRAEAHDKEEARALRLSTTRAELEQEISRLNQSCDAVGHEILALGHNPVDWGELRRLEPFSPQWGIDRGKPIDRVYIEGFLERTSADIRGCVLEVKDSQYTRRFGRDVTRADAVDIDASNTQARWHVDLTDAWAIPDDTYDCVILTQTLHIIYDFRAALFHARRVLKPGGVLLATLPALSRTNPEGGGLSGGDAWRFTEHSARKVFAEAFPPESVHVEVHGNVLAGVAFLEGLGAHELSPAELAHVDPWNPVLFAIRAVKPIEAPVVQASSGRGGIILAYHRIADLPGAAGKLCVPPDLFRAQMEVLRRRFCPVSLMDLLDGVFPRDAVAVTFDDGYLDALTTAAPILAELGIPATFFLTSEGFDEPGETWHDAVDGLLDPAATLPDRLVIEDLTLSTSTAEERLEASRRLQHEWRRRSLDQRAELLRLLRAWRGSDAPPRTTHRLMLPEEVRELLRNPKFEVGGHSVHHLSLPAQPREIALREITESRQHLTELVGREPATFAYPYGEFDTATRDLVRRAGFRGAVTVAAGVVRPGGDAFTLSRVEIGRLAADQFELLLATTMRGDR